MLDVPGEWIIKYYPLFQICIFPVTPQQHQPISFRMYCRYQHRTAYCVKSQYPFILYCTWEHRCQHRTAYCMKTLTTKQTDGCSIGSRCSASPAPTRESAHIHPSRPPSPPLLQTQLLAPRPTRWHFPDEDRNFLTFQVRILRKVYAFSLKISLLEMLIAFGNEHLKTDKNVRRTPRLLVFIYLYDSFLFWPLLPFHPRTCIKRIVSIVLLHFCQLKQNTTLCTTLNVFLIYKMASNTCSTADIKDCLLVY